MMTFKTFYIYSIVNATNGMRYIGCTTNASKRKSTHFSKLRNNNHINPRLQSDFNTYGEEAFKFNILAKLLCSPEDAKIEEDKYINSYKDTGLIYNKNEAQLIFEKDLNGKNNPMFGKNHSEESKSNMSNTKKKLGSAKGANNSNSKISLEDYLLIKEMIFEETGESYEQKYRRLSEMFCVSAITLKRIKLGNHHYEQYLTTKLKSSFKTFCIDFDDTITQNTKFPEVGELKPHADRVIRRLKDNGAEICIWTCRTGDHEILVKEFLDKHDIPYDSFNEILPSERQEWGEGGRKVFAHAYIDDRGVYAHMNGGIDWLQIEKFLFEEVK